MAERNLPNSTESGDEWMRRAQSAMTQSTDYLDSNYRRQLEKNLALFQSRHPPGSKYHGDSYKLRSRLFRPKTRSAVRKTEAAAAAAFFSNEDVVSVTAENDEDPQQQASAEINKELLQYRLTKTIPWFQIVMGGTQDAQVMGVVCSYQHWIYREKRTKRRVPVTDPGTGQAYIGQDGQIETREIDDVQILEDRPAIELVPLENVRFHPGADWLDPINSSPYLVRLFPMFVQDVRAQMRSKDPKTGAPKWFTYNDGQIMSATTNKFDSTRQARQPQRQDAQGNAVASGFNDYHVVWIQEHIHRIDGEDMIWYMLGDTLRLSDAKPLSDVYLHGKRPLVMGTMIIETHTPIPSAPVELTQDLQAEANEISNQRLDNVKFVLNKRWVANRNGRVDIRSLVRNVPGSVTLADNPEKDIREINFPDVTSSAYMEQDRLNVDFDDLAGNFSQSSVQSNRSLNETVGGMSMMLSGASQMTEYGLNILAHTWIEPVLWQLTSLEQHYETDAVVLALAANKAQLYQKFGINEITDQLLQQNLTLRVNVGMGATNPQFKLQRFMSGITALSQIAAAPPPGAKMDEIGKELFGLLGYKDGSRFGFGEQDPNAEDPRLAEAMQMVQQLQQVIEGKRIEAEAETQEKLKLEGLRQEGESRRLELKLMREKETALAIEAERRRTRLLEMSNEDAQARRKQSVETLKAVMTSASKQKSEAA
jgi:hypothetical protein